MPLDEVAYASLCYPTGHLIGSYRGFNRNLPGIRSGPYGVSNGTLRGIERTLSGIQTAAKPTLIFADRFAMVSHSLRNGLLRS